MSDPVPSYQVPLLPAHAAGLARAGGHGALVISGGRPGVGATTVAVQLAATLAQEALRVVLIDADLYRADVANRCSLNVALGIGDVLMGRKSIHEVLQLGPAGMQVLVGAASTEMRNALGERAIQRLFRQMKTLTPHADRLLVDAGNQPSEFTARLWSAAERLLLVTSPDAVAVMDTYALVKTLLSQRPLRPAVSLVVNQADDDAVAADVHRRIDQSCRRFLGLSVELAGGIPRATTRRVGADHAGSDVESTAASLAPAFNRLARRIFAAGEGSSRRLAA